MDRTQLGQPNRLLGQSSLQTLLISGDKTPAMGVLDISKDLSSPIHGLQNTRGDEIFDDFVKQHTKKSVGKKDTIYDDPMDGLDALKAMVATKTLPKPVTKSKSALAAPSTKMTIEAVLKREPSYFDKSKARLNLSK